MISLNNLELAGLIILVLVAGYIIGYEHGRRIGKRIGYTEGLAEGIKYVTQATHKRMVSLHDQLQRNFRN